MKILLATLLLAFSAGGCSSSSSAPSDPLVGKWLGPSSTAAGQCTPGFTFNGTTYEYDFICTLTGGTLGVETELGNYTEKNGVLSLTPTSASCVLNRSHAPSTMSYTVDGTALRVVTPSGGLVLNKIADDPNSVGSGGGGANAEFGCANTGGFVASSIQKL